jgi:hypothetical protein
MTRRRTLAWLSAVVLVCAPLIAAAQGGLFGFGMRNAPYDGRVAIVRVRYQAYPGWAYDYPAMERNLSRVLHDITMVRPNLEAADVLDLDDPEFFRYPLAYLSEPGYWLPSPTEADGLRKYLQKGGFLIVDDFHFANEWAVFACSPRDGLRDSTPAIRFTTASSQSIRSTFPIRARVARARSWVSSSASTKTTIRPSG